ncbi:hypothetical protein DFH06DRAFT_1155076 [Mycena polygramma]|nr:hypothetical protein DFH06DRAFT_1155076 [Mycena polygramma]
MAACVASSSSWTASLPYAPRTSYSRHHQSQQTPLRPTSATWNTKFPAGLDLDLSHPMSMPTANTKPRLRLPSLASTSDLPSRRFDPFADDDAPVASTSQLPPAPAHPYPSQNTPPLARGRSLTPLCITVPSASTSTPVVGRRRAPSFSAGANTPRAAAMSLSMAFTGSSSSSSSYGSGGSSLSNAPSPAPSLCRLRVSPPSSPTPTPAPAVPLAPTPFHARHYPTPDARARLLARTLLNRIHAVGRPRSCSFSSPYSSPYSSSPYSKGGRSANGYESECGGRGYVPSRLSECVTVC